MSEYDPLAEAEELAREAVRNNEQGIYPSEELDEGVHIPTLIESRTLTVLSYLGSAAAPYAVFLPMISLVVPAIKRSPWMRYHAWNSLLLSVVVAAIRGLLNLTMIPVALSSMTCSDTVCSALSMLSMVLVPTVVALYSAQLAYDAVKRQPTDIPVVSAWAHRLAKDDEVEECPETEK